MIDLNARYTRATRMVWTLIGIIIMLIVGTLIVGMNNISLNHNVGRLTNQLEAQENTRRVDRAEQRYALCKRTGELAPPADLCVGYKTLKAAYKSEGVETDKTP